MKLAMLIKICLNIKFSKSRVGKNLSGIFVLENGFKKGDILSQFYFNFDLGRFR